MRKRFYKAGLAAFFVLIIQVIVAQETAKKDSLDCAYELSQAVIDLDTARFDSIIIIVENIDCTTHDSVTALMYAAEQGNLYFTKRLLKAGADVNALPKNKVSALLSAVNSGKKEVVELLLKAGANPNISDKNNITPAIRAVQSNNFELLKLLDSFNATIDNNIINESTVLHFAAAHGNDSMLVYLLEKDLDVNANDALGFTPLMVATHSNHTSTAELLVQYNADINKVSKEELTALTLAILNGNAYLTELFLLNGADKSPLQGKAKDYWYYAEGTGKVMKKVLRENGVKRNILPVFGDWIGGFSAAWSDGHFESELMAGIRETKYNLMVQTRLGLTPFVYSSLDRINGTLYQFWERNFWVGAEVDKYFAFHKRSELELGAFAGIQAEYRFGNYQGTDYKPSSELNLFPVGGLYFRYDVTEFRAGFAPRKWNDETINRFEIQMHIYLSRL